MYKYSAEIYWKIYFRSILYKEEQITMYCWKNREVQVV